MYVWCWYKITPNKDSWEHIIFIVNFLERDTTEKIAPRELSQHLRYMYVCNVCSWQSGSTPTDRSGRSVLQRRQIGRARTMHDVCVSGWGQERREASCRHYSRTRLASHKVKRRASRRVSNLALSVFPRHGWMPGLLGLSRFPSAITVPPYTSRYNHLYRHHFIVTSSSNPDHAQNNNAIPALDFLVATDHLHSTHAHTHMRHDWVVAACCTPHLSPLVCYLSLSVSLFLSISIHSLAVSTPATVY